jgi:DnaJ-class molecular chaperone
VDLDLAPMTVTCPRCGGTGDERFYGPCARCRDDLRATLGGVAKDVEVAAYEPKMNVVPNQVATKE